MDKSNTSGSAEDVTETQKYANCSLNPDTLEQQSFPSSHTSPLGVRKNFKRAANRGRENFKRSSENTGRVLRSRSVADKSPIDAAQTLTERAAKKPPSDSVHTLVKPSAKRIKRDRPKKIGLDDELSN